MTEPLFLADLNDPIPGSHVYLEGDEGRHAATVRRIRVGETIMVADGSGNAVRGPVIEVDRSVVVVEVEDVLHKPVPKVKYAVIQALAKGDRASLAIEAMTEMGVDEIIPWRSKRSVVKWAPERTEKHLMRWRSTVREATKQSRRFRVPIVSMPMTTGELVARIPLTALTLILHEEAEQPLSAIDLPDTGEIMVVVGPEGGIAPEELESLVAAGGRPVTVADAVLRTSTAGVVSLAQLQALNPR